MTNGAGVAEYRANGITPEDLQTVALQVNSAGALITAGGGTTDANDNQLVSQGTQSDTNNDKVGVKNAPSNPTGIAAIATTNVLDGSGVLRKIIVSAVAGSTIKVYDALTATNQIGVDIIVPAGVTMEINFSIAVSVGITIGTSSTDNVNILWDSTI